MGTMDLHQDTKKVIIFCTSLTTRKLRTRGAVTGKLNYKDQNMYSLIIIIFLAFPSLDQELNNY